MSLEREKPEQIPNSENLENTKKIINEQNNISGQKKEINVTDFQGVAKLGQILINIPFPTDKKKIIEFLFIITPCIITISTSKKLCTWLICTSCLRNPPKCFTISTFRTVDFYCWQRI